MKLDSKTYFITGIDTDAGKSYATGIIARRLMDEGRTVITQKFVQTGGDDNDGKSIDIELHRKIMGTGLLPRDKDGTTAPIIFGYPASPHLAAEMDGRTFDVDAVERSRKILEAEYDTVLMEGAGGLIVPLTYEYTSLDYLVEAKLPVILVTSGKLGSINHTLLSIETAHKHGIKIAALAYNRHFDTDKAIGRSTYGYFKDYTERHMPDCQIIDIEDINL